MRWNIIKYCHEKIVVLLNRFALFVEDLQINDSDRLPRRNSDQLLSSIDRRKMFEVSHSGPKFSLRKFFIVIALTIVLTALFLNYVFIYFPVLMSLTNMPLIGSIILMVLLLPTLYMIFYKPMISQINSLEISEVKMRELAHFDELTGLYNRRGFMTSADQLLKLSDRAQRGFILIYADLDNLKRINDEGGHDEGDRALKTIGDVLQRTFRKSDILGRVGGDEFAVLAVEAKAESLTALRKRLQDNLEHAAYNLESEHKLTFSLGMLFYDPDQQRSIERLLKSADKLMYQEKKIRSMSRVSS